MPNASDWTDLAESDQQSLDVPALACNTFCIVASESMARIAFGETFLGMANAPTVWRAALVLPLATAAALQLTLARTMAQVEKAEVLERGGWVS